MRSGKAPIDRLVDRAGRDLDGRADNQDAPAARHRRKGRQDGPETGRAGRPATQEKGNVLSDLGRDLDQLRGLKPELVEQVGRFQKGGRVGAAPTEPGTHRDPFEEPHGEGQRAAQATFELSGRFEDQVLTLDRRTDHLEDATVGALDPEQVVE
jgi:hypothetical protein